jgi:hypothetical protein
MAGNRMSKTEFVEALANQSGLDKKQVNAVLNALTDVVYKELKAKTVDPWSGKTDFRHWARTPEREGLTLYEREDDFALPSAKDCLSAQSLKDENLHFNTRPASSAPCVGLFTITL